MCIAKELRPFIKFIFAKVIIVALHEKECTMAETEHVHVLGQVRHTSRSVRDTSQKVLDELCEQYGIKEKWTGILRKLYATMSAKPIKSEAHMTNAFKYIKQYKILDQDDELLELALGDFQQREISYPQKEAFTDEQLTEFRESYPKKEDWQSVLRSNSFFAKRFTERFNAMEKAVQEKQRVQPLTDEENKKIICFKPYLDFVKCMIRITGLLKSVGGCFIFIGQADTLKSTTARLICQKTGPYHIWPGTQLIEKDILKYDSAVRDGVKQIILEEVEWQHVQKKITINDTLGQLKALFAGDGLNVRTAKTSSNTSSTLKLDLIIASMNERPNCGKAQLTSMINAYQDFLKRFVVFDFDKYRSFGLLGVPDSNFDKKIINLFERYINTQSDWGLATMNLVQNGILTRNTGSFQDFIDNLNDFHLTESYDMIE